MNRLLLSWYWPGMITMVKECIRTCETCQVAKAGGTVESKNRQRLYAGRPWQKVAIDLVGPLPETERRHRWILVLTDHFSRWQDAIPLVDATAPCVAAALDERVFCYFGIPEQIHTDQGAQFESQLFEELCRLWGVDKSRTTPYHPQSNGIVERHNRGLGDSLRAMLLDRDQEDWDLLLPQIMRALRGTPHSTTGETANLLLLGRELRLPDQLVYDPIPRQDQPRHEYVTEMQARLESVHELLREQQVQVRQADQEEPPLYVVGDLVLLENRRRRRGECPKLAPKFVGPYKVEEVFPNHTYRIERTGQRSVQNEKRLKLFHPCTEGAGQAPGQMEPTRRPNMRGRVTRRSQVSGPSEMEPPMPEPTIPTIDPRLGMEDPSEQPGGDPVEASSSNSGEDGEESIDDGQVQPSRPSRARRPPAHLLDYECYPVQVTQSEIPREDSADPTEAIDWSYDPNSPVEDSKPIKKGRKYIARPVGATNGGDCVMNGEN
jgi:transposase InsO family protein